MGLEILLGVLTAGVLVQQVVVVSSISLTRCRSSSVAFSSACFIPANRLVEHLAAEQILDLLGLLLRLGALRLVVASPTAFAGDGGSTRTMSRP